MESIGVLLLCPLSPYLRQEISKRFKLFKYYESDSKPQFLSQHSDTIRAVVGNGVHGATAELIDSLPNLEIVASHSAGLDKIDLVKCKERGIRVTYTPDGPTEDVADLAILLAMATLRRVCESDRYVRRGMWTKGDFKLTSKFSGKSVGIIGLGRIGSAIAKRASAFNCPISYYSRSPKPNSTYKHHPTPIALASSCQILIISCELNEETHHIVDRQVIEALGPNGIVVNIARGQNIDEKELVLALVEGRLGGAGLDVFESEPEVPEELFGLDNVVLSPHAGATTVETRVAMADLVVANMVAHFQKKPLLTPVDL